MKWMKRTVPPLIILAFFTALFAGIRRFGFPENSSTVQFVEVPWSYTTDTGAHGEAGLPNVLSLPAQTKEVQLITTLPEWTGEAYALHFISIEQMVEVWIDGTKRYTYGALPGADDFVYRSAHHINQVPLRQEDSGKQIRIIYRSDPIFYRELGQLRAIRIGTMSDLVLDEFGRSTPYIAISFFAILLTLISLIILIIYRDMSLRENFCVFLLTILTVIFFNSENNALWTILHYSTVLSALVDWSFFYIDPLIHFAIWLCLYAAGWKFRGFGRQIPLIIGIFYILAVGLSLTNFFNFNLARPFFMGVGFLFTVFLYVDRMWYEQERRIFVRGGGGAAVTILLLGYYADYGKYLRMLLPMNTKWSVLLQVKLPLQFFTAIALVISSFVVLKETLERVAKQKADVKVEAQTAQILIEYARQQYENIVQRDMSLRSIKHDMQFYFRTASALLADGRIEEARQYLAGLGDTVATAKISSWCVDYVANIIISWYADRFQQQSIPFHVTADIPVIREEVHADISSILSNALQNALEGCEGQQDPFVRLLAKPKGNQLLFIVENCCSIELCSTLQDFPTTKPEEGHGIGMASIKAAAKRHNGYFNASAKDRIFKVEVVLCDVLADRKGII